jgi:hypothetical protein
MKKIGFPTGSRFWSNAVGYGEGLLAILLNSCGAQTRKTMLVDGKLPGQEFINGQRVAAAGLLKGEQTAANSGNHFGLPANNPPFGPGRGQIRNC